MGMVLPDPVDTALTPITPASDSRVIVPVEVEKVTTREDTGPHSRRVGSVVRIDPPTHTK